MLKVLLGLPKIFFLQKDTNILWNQNLGVDPFVGQLVENRQVGCWWTPWKRDLVSKSRWWIIAYHIGSSVMKMCQVEHSMIVSSSGKGRLCHWRLRTMIIFQNGCFFFRTVKCLLHHEYLLVSDIWEAPRLEHSKSLLEKIVHFGAACRKLGILGKIHF